MIASFMSYFQQQMTAMRLYFFTIPAKFPDEMQQTLNAFCTHHRVLTIDKQFVELGNESYWSICVTVMQGDVPDAAKITDGKKGAVDYKEKLGEQDFAIYVQLRNLRKILSEQENIPAYALFTNEQLATMVTQRVDSLAELSKIEGIGKARLEKYGKSFLQLLQSIRKTAAGNVVGNEQHEAKKD